MLADLCFIPASHCAEQGTVFVTRLKSTLVGAKQKDRWGVSRSRFKSNCLSCRPPLLGLHRVVVFAGNGDETVWRKLGGKRLVLLRVVGPSPRWMKGSP